MVGRKKHIVYALLPGIQSIDIPLSKIINGDPNVTRLKFQVVENLWKETGVDIAVLKLLEGIQWGSQVHINFTSILKQDQRVDIVAYPGAYSEEILLEQYGAEISDMSKTGYNEAEKTLPRKTLVASCGKILSGGDSPGYYLSTVGGMSGAAVVFEGEVYGISP